MNEKIRAVTVTVKYIRSGWGGGRLTDLVGEEGVVLHLKGLSRQIRSAWK
jgi:hypothetical protein